MIAKLNTLLLLLCRGISTRKLYFLSHPNVVEFSRKFMASLEDFCRETGREKLFIGVVNDQLVFEGRVLVGPSIMGRQLIDFAGRLHCGGFSFFRRLTEKEFGSLLDLTSELTQPLAGLDEARALLQSRGITNIEIARQYLGSLQPGEGEEAWQGQDTGQVLQSPTLVYQALFDAVSRAHSSAAAGSVIDVDRTRNVSEYLLHFTKTRFSDVMQYVHYPDYDSYTVGHSVRVATLAVFVAWAFGWNRELLLALGTAGLLHDVGKGKISQEILFKGGRLTEEEMEEVRLHPRLGAEILLAQKHTTPLDISAAWGHHIRQDGGGYPPQAPWMVRHPIIALLQICDVFEALTAARPYKAQLSPREAFGIMMADLPAFQPSLLASFIHVIGIYPPGNIVTLSDGSRGTVAWVGPCIDRPTVSITHDPSGQQLLPADAMQIDLSSERYGHLSVVDLQI
jgi:HD-GYP domain-containing protein (c-di-GMP phosphodiesterase class II)